MPVTNPILDRTDKEFVDEVMASITKINPQISHGDLLTAESVGRLRHAQPICPPGFAGALPSVRTPVAGLQIADTCFYYPEDRGIASTRLGRSGKNSNRV